MTDRRIGGELEAIEDETLNEGLLSSFREDSKNVTAATMDEELQTRASFEGGTTKTSFRRLVPRKASLFVGNILPREQVTNNNINNDRDEDEDEDERRSSVPRWESLDYEKNDSLWSRASFLKPNRGVITLERWTNSVCIGVIVGFTAFALMQLIAILSNWRLEIIDQYTTMRAVAFCFTGALFSFLAALLTLTAPTAEGAGMSLVIAELNGVSNPHATSIWTAFVKFFGTIASCSSGLGVGPEGPLVQIGAIIGSWFSRPRQWRVMGDTDFRNIVSAGAAAGLSAAFGAPIGGVLFASEEASTFWSHTTTKRALLCSTMAVFVLSFCHDSVGRPFGLLLLKIPEEEKKWELFEIPGFLLLATLCGVFASLVTKAVGFISHFRRKTKSGRVIEATIITLVIALSQLLLSNFVGKCVDGVSSTETNTTTMTSVYPSNVAVPLRCSKEGQFNNLASLMIGPREFVLKFLLSGKPKDSTSLLALITCFGFQVLSVIFSAECALPAGLFLPTLNWGALLGNICCKVLEKAYGRKLGPAPYAMIGATSALGGFFRGSISLVVIVLEGTSQLTFLLPLLLCIFFANKIGGFIAPSFYADQIVRRNIPYLYPSAPEHACYDETTKETKTAKDVCSKEVITFREIEHVHRVEEVLKNTLHNGFPVIKEIKDDSGNIVEKRLIGLVLRSQLLTLLARRAFVENAVIYNGDEVNKCMEHPLMDPRDHSFSTCSNSTEQRFKSMQQKEEYETLERAMRTFHQRKMFTDRSADVGSKYIDRMGLTNTERECHLVLSDFMQLSPSAVQENCSVERLWRTFRGIRHLCVVGTRNQLLGIITRADLLKIQNKQQ